MVKYYSNSRLSLYEQCPEAFKVKYIEKTFPDLPKRIDLFFGEIVHSSLEWFYNEIKVGKKTDLDALIFYFVDSWKKNFRPSKLLLNEKTPQSYIDKGIKFLIEYYSRNFPFEENTIETEKRVTFPLNEEYFIEGYIDRLVLNKEGEYEIHDYKTSEILKTQEEIDTDRQLSFYHLGLKEFFGKEIKVKLVWHFLAHNKTIFSERKDEQLEEVKKNTLELIKKIENTKIWPSCGSRHCDWCVFKKENGIVRNNYGYNYFLQ